ncbi:MAG: hypothetical protein K8S23_14290 [Candidatus Cloacimonetes bacterium]|nr:hypothetical protein [Candidatus Cloacimonadota bacterium]
MQGTTRNSTIDIGAYEYWGCNGVNPANPELKSVYIRMGVIQKSNNHKQ